MFAWRIRVSLTELVKYNDLQEILKELWGSMLNKLKKTRLLINKNHSKLFLKLNIIHPCISHFLGLNLLSRLWVL